MAAEGESGIVNGATADNQGAAAECLDGTDVAGAAVAEDRLSQFPHQDRDGDSIDGGVSVEGKTGGERVISSNNEAAAGAGDGPGAGWEEKHDDNRSEYEGQDEVLADRSSNDAGAAQGKEQEQHAVIAQSGGQGGDPPLSPQQLQQQASSMTRTQDDERRSGARGAAGTTSGQTPSGPLAPTWPAYCDPTYRMPEKLAVRVLVDGEVKEMTIKVVRFEGTKVFQGGYRHRGTGKVFHHASTQFGQRERPVKETAHLRTRNTQTSKFKTTTMQTTNECGTQVGH